MSQHINRFIDRLRQAENRQQRDIVISISDARDLHADITRLLISLQTLQEQATKTNNTEAVQVEIGGGQF